MESKLGGQLYYLGSPKYIQPSKDAFHWFFLVYDDNALHITLEESRFRKTVLERILPISKLALNFLDCTFNFSSPFLLTPPQQQKKEYRTIDIPLQQS